LSTKKVYEALKKFQEDKKNKRKHQKNEIIGALNKNQNETGNTINREINKLRAKIDNNKEQVTHDIENLRKKNETEIQRKMEGHLNRID
jgi:gas vesicle protein